MKRILIVDDDIAVTNYFNVFLMQTGIFEPLIVNDSRKVSGLLANELFDVIMLDLDMPAISGLDILLDIKSRKIKTPVVILTGVNDVNLAVKAMKSGAFEYLVKPVDEEKLLEVLDIAMEHSKLSDTIDQLPRQLKRENLDNKNAFDKLISINPEMIRLFHQAEKMADSDLNIFIWGETGTGKESLARAIHDAGSRKDKEFLSVKIDAQDPENLPGFLFGQVKTWSGSKGKSMGLIEKAQGGTIFINHIEALPVPLQRRLNRILQTGEYYSESSTEIKKADLLFIIASTNDLTAPQYKNRFSQDLLYHIIINSIEIPPLRERIEDIECLSRFFLETEVLKEGKGKKELSREFLNFLRNYDFPGNVNELKAVILYSANHEESAYLSINSLPPYCIRTLVNLKNENIFVPRLLSEVISKEVSETLNFFDMNKAKAAESLGITVEEIDKIL